MLGFTITEVVVGISLGLSLGTCCRDDWELASTSYSYQILFIHIKGVWYALYVVSGHKGATP
jgi:hypothetical protein